MKHDGGGDDQQRALGGFVPSRASALARRQVEALGEKALLRLAKPRNGGVQARRQRRRHVVGIAQLHRREPDDSRELVEIAVSPSGGAGDFGRARGAGREYIPHQTGARNHLARGYPVGIADGDGAVGEPLFDAARGVPDRLAHLGGGLPLLRLQRDSHGADADVDVDSPAAARAFLPRVQPALAQKLRQPDVQGMLMLSRGH